MTVAAGDAAGSQATAGMVAFAGLLRRFGLGVPLPRVELALRALANVDTSDREEAYWALRCTLTSDVDEGTVFDAAFAVLWDGVPVPAPGPGSPARSSSESTPSGTAEVGGALAGSAAEGREDGDATGAGARWSAIERLRELDFRDYGAEELASAANLIAELARILPRRQSRRLRAAPTGVHVDRRATLRNAMRTEGHPVRLAWRRSAVRPRKLVFVVDVSGSMEAYARPLMMFLQAARQASRDIEAFAFGTRLTRLTDELGGRSPDAALDRVARTVPDWAGGTRIGENLKALNDFWGRRGVTRGAIVTIVSDGWERGDVELLGSQMKRLRRSSHRLIWVNPLAGDPHFQPLAAGMATALPHLHAFLPGHNLRSLEALVGVLAEPLRGRPWSAVVAGTRRGGAAENPAVAGGLPTVRARRANGGRVSSKV